MIFSQHEVVQWIFLYKYYVLFPVMVVEGPVVTLIAGMFISTGHLDGVVSFMVLAAGLAKIPYGSFLPSASLQPCPKLWCSSDLVTILAKAM